MKQSLVNFLLPKFYKCIQLGALLALMLGFSGKQSLAQSNIDWQNEFDRCYQLDWYYETQANFRSWDDPDQRNNLLWYCQAKPKSAASFSFRQYQSYQDEWLDAVDFSLLRCERGGETCTYRCALAPRVCAPHFWP